MLPQVQTHYARNASVQSQYTGEAWMASWHLYLSAAGPHPTAGKWVLDHDTDPDNGYQGPAVKAFAHAYSFNRSSELTNIGFLGAGAGARLL